MYKVVDEIGDRENHGDGSGSLKRWSVKAGCSSDTSSLTPSTTGGRTIETLKETVRRRVAVRYWGLGLGATLSTISPKPRSSIPSAGHESFFGAGEYPDCAIGVAYARFG
jgi:hypothetical protein